MWQLVASSGEVADYIQLSTTQLTLPPGMAAEKCRKTHKRLCLEPVFCLSFLGYCTYMAVQLGGLCGKGPAPSVDIKVSF